MFSLSSNLNIYFLTFDTPEIISEYGLKKKASLNIAVSEYLLHRMFICYDKPIYVA